MQEPIEVQRLRGLLGSERFLRERLKGEQLKKSKVSSSGNTPSSDRSTTELHDQTQHPSKQDFSPSDVVCRDPVIEVEPLGTGKPNKRPKAPWSDSEGSEPEGDQYKTGSEAQAGTELCPILAASRYPYTFLNHDKEHMEAVARVSFNNGQFWERKWSLFHVSSHGVNSGKPVVLVPRKEVETLLLEAGGKLNTFLDWPSKSVEPGFSISFTIEEPKPIFIGTSRSHEQYKAMQERSHPNSSKKDICLTEDDNGRSLITFRGKIEAAARAARASRHRSKPKSKRERDSARSKWREQLSNAQCYLGLRPVRSTTAGIGKDPVPLNMEVSSPGNSRSRAFLPLDVSAAPLFDFADDVVFIAIDVEAHERHSHMLTELGVATLDSRTLRNIAPGRAAKNWRKLIKYRHLRIEEYKSHRNSEFITGCPDRFEDTFGESEFIRKADIPRAMAVLCRPPFPLEVAPFLAFENPAAVEETMNSTPEERRLVLIGHDFDTDMRYLRSAGFEIQCLSSVIRILDTSIMHRALMRETQPASLASLLHLLEIPGWNLHNAGNDAGYTLQAFLGIAVEHLAEPRYTCVEEQLIQQNEHVA